MLIMKRIGVWFLAVSFTFIPSIGVTLISLESLFPAKLPEISSPVINDEPAETPVLDFCELANNPEKYDGQTVRLNAKITFGTEGVWFSDARCGVDNAAFAYAKSPEARKKINQSRAREKGAPWDFEVNLIVVGKFSNVVFKDWCRLTTPFQFEILKVERASKVK